MKYYLLVLATAFTYNLSCQTTVYDSAILDYYDKELGIDNVGFSYIVPEGIFENLRDDIFEFKIKMFSKHDSINVLSAYNQEHYFFEHDFDKILMETVQNENWIWKFENYRVNVLSESQFDSFLEKSNKNVVIIINRPINLDEDYVVLIEIRVMKYNYLIVKWKLFKKENNELKFVTTIKEY